MLPKYLKDYTFSSTCRETKNHEVGDFPLYVKNTLKCI